MFDEPLSNLDAKLRSAIRTELAILHKRLERTVIYVAHDQIEAMSMADRIVIMNHGWHRAADRLAGQVYNGPENNFVAGFIGSPAMNFLDGALSGGELPEVRGEGICLPLHGRLAAAAKAHRSAEVTVGLRPERFTVGGTGGTEASVFANIQLSVEMAEYIGSSQLLAARIQDVPITASIEVGPDSPPFASS